MEITDKNRWRRYDRYQKLANNHYSKRNVSPVDRLVLETQQDDIVWTSGYRVDTLGKAERCIVL